MKTDKMRNGIQCHYTVVHLPSGDDVIATLAPLYALLRHGGI